MKMARRNNGGVGEVDVAPFGYDRCGVPRTKPYIHKPSASPQPSSKWKPCPPGTPGYKGTEGSSSDDNDKEVSTGKKNVKVVKPAGSSDAAIDEPAQTAAPTKSSTSDDTDDDDEEQDYTTTAMPDFSGGEVDGGNAAGSKGDSGDSSASTVTTTSYAQVTITTSSLPPSTTSKKDEPAPSSSDEPANTSQTEVKIPSSPKPDPTTSKAAEESPKPTPQTPAPTPDQDGQGMLGLAWDWRNPSGALAAWAGASRVYTWSAWPPSDPLPAGMEWYPQFWGPAKEGEFAANVASGLIKPGMTILGYNEPDQAGQANLGIQDGINSYLAQITPYASKGFRLATPGCTSDDNGLNWIRGFINGCAGRCGFSVLQTHYYGTDPYKFIAYIEQLHNEFGLPIIVSEYAAETFGNGAELDQAGVDNYVAVTQNWLKSQSYVESYFYFGPVTSQALNGVNPANKMIDDGGAINALGWQYKNNA